MTDSTTTALPGLGTLLRPSARAFADTGHAAFVDGERRSGTGARIERIDPSSGKLFGGFAEAHDELVAEAVESSARSFATGWGALTPAEREASLHRFADLVEANLAELAEYDSLEGGKPVSQVAAVDLPLAIEQLRYYAGWPTKLTGSLPSPAPDDRHVYTRRVPLGVVAAITPWNFPLCQAIIKTAPALAAGCTVVLKPSELTSLSSLRLAELAHEAGLPAGTLNVVAGRGTTTGAALVGHEQVAKISFTGSTPVGRALGALAGERLQHASLELGGKNPHIVLPDADLDRAAAAAATTAFFYSGQVCFSGSRLLVHESVAERFIDAVRAHAEALVLGHGLDAATTMGPLASANHLAKVEGYLEDAAASGGRIVFGGRRLDDRDGYFLEPTAILQPDDGDRLVQEEIFGPVLAVQTFSSVDEAVERANGTRFGLAAGLWTRDVSLAHGIARRLEAGTVWVNTYGDFNASVAFGGVKASGLGRDCGPEALDKYLDTQSVWIAID